LRKVNPLAAATGLLLLISAPVFAHHGNAGYDMSTMMIRKAATIVDLEWTNPHCQIHFDATDDKGNVEHWTLEAPPPGMLQQRNWERKSLKAGDVVTVYFHAAKNGVPVGIVQKVIFANGDILHAYPDPN
jgi:hypothetical protein